MSKGVNCYIGVRFVVRQIRRHFYTVIIKYWDHLDRKYSFLYSKSQHLNITVRFCTVFFVVLQRGKREQKEEPLKCWHKGSILLNDCLLEIWSRSLPIICQEIIGKCSYISLYIHNLIFIVVLILEDNLEIGAHRAGVCSEISHLFC